MSGEEARSGSGVLLAGVAMCVYVRVFTPVCMFYDSRATDRTGQDKGCCMQTPGLLALQPAHK